MAYYRFNNRRAGYYQEGGAMAPLGGGGDPMALILQAAQQAVQANDAQLALQVCQALVQIASGGAGGGAPAGPEGGAPAGPEGGAPEGEPTFRRGGRLLYRSRY